MRTRFHQSLDDLKEKLLRMGGLAEQAVDRAIEAYRLRDAALCQQVLDGERAINTMEREIDELALDLLAMQQPMAVDLRFIIAIVKINADLERVGDQAVNIVQRVMELIKLQEAELSADIPRVGTVASKHGANSAGIFHLRGRRSGGAGVEDRQPVGSAERRGVPRDAEDDARESVVDQPGAKYAVDFAKPGTRGRSRHEHCGRCDLLGTRCRCCGMAAPTIQCNWLEAIEKGAPKKVRSKFLRV